eukprot:3098242-Amphidinium_carterae.1
MVVVERKRIRGRGVGSNHGNVAALYGVVRLSQRFHSLLQSIERRRDHDLQSSSWSYLSVDGPPML